MTKTMTMNYRRNYIDQDTLDVFNAYTDDQLRGVLDELVECDEDEQQHELASAILRRRAKEIAR